MLPGRAERLPGPAHFLLEPAGVVGVELAKKALVEGVPVAGDPRDQLGQRDGGIVRLRAAAADAAGHEDRPRQRGGRFE